MVAIRRRGAVVLVCMALAASACSASPDAVADEQTELTEQTTSTIEDYPDAQTRALWARAREARPVPNSALPPRHLDPERFPETLVDRNLIVSGGVAPDGITPIDEPWFEQADAVDWLDEREAVLALELDGEARAYPVQVMILHEIVNDEIAGSPVTVTYCPLCNSAVAFDRRAEDGTLLDFGVSGALYQSALVMYDRQSESLWTHFDGRAVVGDRVGQVLERVPISTVAWADFVAAHPDGQVLGRVDPNKPYGVNPYGSYDRRSEPLAGFFRGLADSDDRLASMDRVVGVEVSGGPIAVSWERLERDRLVEIRSATSVDSGSDEDERLAVFWSPGATSALDRDRVDEGAEVGAAAVFRTRRSLRVDGDRLIDPATGDRWDVLGRPDESSLGRAADPGSAHRHVLVRVVYLPP